LEYLALGKTEKRAVDATAMQTVLDHYFALAAEITAKKEQHHTLPHLELFPTQKGEACKRCTFMDVCPAFSQQSAFSSSSLTDESVQHLVREYAKDHETIKALETKKEELKNRLEHFFSTSDYQRIFGTSYHITAGKRDNWTIKEEAKVREVLQQKGLLESSLSLDKTKVKKLFENGELPADLVEERESVSLLMKKK
jgi:hypothetical protein